MEATAQIQGAVSQSLRNMRAAPGVHAKIRNVPNLLQRARASGCCARHNEIELVMEEKMAKTNRAVTASDPIADLLTRIRNASKASHANVLMPSSKMKESIVKVLEEEGYIVGYEVVKEPPQPLLRIELKYDEDLDPAVAGLKRISKPGLRVYTGYTGIRHVLGGVGISMVSTSQGVMTGGQARRRRLGGEVICHVW